MLDQQLHNQRRDERSRRELTGPVWGVVLDETSGEVTLKLASIDGGTHAWGPVPYVLANGPASPTPADGDDAFLHTDQDGEPAYAVIWT